MDFDELVEGERHTRDVKKCHWFITLAVAQYIYFGIL